MRSLGHITKLQVQADQLAPNGVYSPAEIVEVDELRLTVDGPIGRTDGGWLIDSHHRHHPCRGGRFNPRRALSFGFTGHYAAMVDMFRPVATGAAGENVIIEHDGIVTKADLTAGVTFVTAAGPVRFDDAAVAEPCLPFTCYMLDRPGLADDVVADDREKLRKGMRGFLVSPRTLERTASFRVGDEVLVAS